jgi:hypothetical protein
MNACNQVAVILTLDGDRRPIQGRMDIDGRTSVAFHGWLELNDHLERALVAPANPSPTTIGMEAQR